MPVSTCWCFGNSGILGASAALSNKRVVWLLHCSERSWFCLIWLFFFLYVCSCTHAWVYRGVCICLENKRQPWLSFLRILQVPSIYLFIWTMSLTSLEFVKLLRMAVQQVVLMSLSPHPKHWQYITPAKGLEFLLWSPCFQAWICMNYLPSFA